ncbi:hypothetical protein [Streptomyces sp. H34-S4]|uniref:hypothetical protein n=1 Tax=Streptomyces sp. H34-S4 TaxID=2996463 RepID=UPI00226E47ED|nr:hypothetical protein [Streptomyces sp. H34-S4]MCY0935161.1 hypothetical protein [Streptomyces sp. H34-S4]
MKRTTAKRSVAALGAAVAIVVSSLAVAPSAQAGNSPLAGEIYGRVESGGVIRVDLQTSDAPAEVGNLTVRVREKNGGPVVGRVGGFTGGQCQDELCYLRTYDSAPGKLDVKMGVYDLELVRNEGKSDEQVGINPGILNFAVNARFTSLTSSVSTVSYDHRSGVASGTLVAEDPNTHEVKPFAGADVDLYPTAVAPSKLTTDAAGRFTGPFGFYGNEPRTVLSARLGGNWANSKEIALQVRKQTAKLTVKSPGAVATGRYGAFLPVSGTLTRIAEDGTEQPVSGTPFSVTKDGCVVVTSSEECGNGHDNTRPDGSFEVDYRVLGNATMSVNVSSPWFDPVVPYRFSVNATHTSAFSGLQGSVDRFQRVTFTGKLVVNGGTVPVGTSAKLQFQYSTDKGKTWKFAGNFTTTYGATFTRTALQPAGESTLWRLAHIYSGDVGPTNSQPVSLGRQLTKITSDDVTPEGVRRGTSITAKGLLTQKTGTLWKPHAGQTVRIYFKPATPDGTWKQIGTATTLANGTFSKKFTAQQDGTWQMRYVDAPTTHYASNGREDYVDVL